MFTIESRINGALIGVIYGHNEGHTDDYEICNYTYCYTEISTGESIRGKLTHKRSDGLTKLVAAIYKDMDNV